MRKLQWLVTLMMVAMPAYGGTVTGTLLGASGLPIANGTLNFNLQQAGLAIGTGSVVPTTASCYTSVDGSVVGLPNPLSPPTVAINYGSGSLPAGTYYVMYAFYATGALSLASPELAIQMTGAGSLIVSPPATFPANATGMTVFIGTTSGGESGQGNTITHTSGYTQSSALGAGIPLPATNTAPCLMAFNDTIIPYSGYNVSLVSSTGNAYPGWPQAWQLNGGANGTVNVSNGAPLWNGTVIYPQPLLSQPLNHGPQSIAGALNMTGYDLVNVGALGVGTSTPAYPVDVENGYINTNRGYLVAGGAGSIGQCLVSNGTYFGPGSCGVAPTVYYQHLQKNGSLYPQEPYANFSGNFNLVDNAGSTRTDIDLEPTTVAAGTYYDANIQVDLYGRIIGASNGGSSTSVTKALIITTGICSTANTGFAQCSMSESWSSAFADANYALTCTPSAPSALTLSTIWFSAKTSAGFTLTIQNADASGANAISVSEIDCVGVHP